MAETGSGAGAAGDNPAGQAKTAEGDAAGTRGEAAPGTGSSHTAQHGTPLVSYVAGLDRDTFKICKEFLRPFKKSLRKLRLPQHLPKKKKVKYTKESLTIIGDRINMFLQQHCKASEVKHWKTVMWRFVSLFSEKDERQLQKLYKYIKSNRMDKFKLLCCHSESTDSVPGRKLRETSRSGPTTAGTLAEVPEASRNNQGTNQGAEAVTTNAPTGAQPSGENDG
ncbi:uncharacterized protein C17orf64 homolog [Cygnus olor]|uniref:uncharacterized protein C17orf64 homolog n=1 Tax=Cygnus olor TaxID=8869 RepID=UPI001ADE804D|nr:uncharacterized protein C17orf64 homolog [Cygnus olor]